MWLRKQKREVINISREGIYCWPDALADGELWWITEWDKVVLVASGLELRNQSGTVEAGGWKMLKGRI